MSLYPLLLIGIPLAGALAVSLPVWGSVKNARLVGVATSLLLLAVVFGVLNRFDPGVAATQFEWSTAWLPQLKLSVVFGVTGISALLIFLTGILSVSVLILTINRPSVESRWMTVHLLLLTSFLMGVFLARDLISFYVFWEATLIPIFFLIGIWGGTERVTANLTFFIFTLAGSLFLLIAILFLGFTAGQYLSSVEAGFVSDFTAINLLLGGKELPAWVFWFVIVAFGIKAALFPLHMWLPKTYTQAPIPGLVLLSGVMAKMGTYGMLVFGYLFLRTNLQNEAMLLSVLAMIGILYAAWIAYTRKGLLEIVAFSSMSHMGFIILGIVAGTLQSLQGSVIQMVNHGISTGAVFLLIGTMQQRDSQFDGWKGTSNSAPVLATLFMIAMLSSIGLPGLNGFIGEFNILIGSFSSDWISPWVTALSTLGVVMAAAYMLLPYKNVFFGQPESLNPAHELTASEVIGLTPLFVMMVWIGIAPSGLMNISLEAVQALLR